MRLTVAACLAFGGATVLGVLAVGPAVMRLLFGPEFDYDRVGLALVAAGMGLYLAATTVNQAVLAQGRARLAAASWAVAAAFFVAFLLLADMEEVREVEVAFLATAALLSALLYLAYRRPVGGRARIQPGLDRGAGGDAGRGGRGELAATAVSARRPPRRSPGRPAAGSGRAEDRRAGHEQRGAGFAHGRPR